MRHAHHLHRIHCGLPLPSPPLCNQSTLALTHTSVESTPQPPTLLTSRPCPSHPQTTPNNNTPPRSFFSLQHSRHPQRRPFHPQPPCLHALRPPSPPPPYSHTAMWWRVRPPAAHHHSRHHRNVRPRRPKCRPHRASSASRMMMPHSSATQPQPQSSADRTSARKPQRLPPRKPSSHTQPHACAHKHDMRHET